jgi:hypothetical protein
VQDRTWLHMAFPAGREDVAEVVCIQVRCYGEDSPLQRLRHRVVLALRGGNEDAVEIRRFIANMHHLY